MRIAYLDGISGISGDMTLSALIDAGVPFSQLKTTLNKVIYPHRISLSVSRVERCGLNGLKINIKGADKHLSYHEILRLIKKNSLPVNVRESALKVLNRLTDAESKVHHTHHLKEIRLHELGSIDTVIDITGAVWCLDYLNIKEIYVSPLPLTEGTIKTHHGLYPLPAPATLEMLKDYDLFKSDVKAELITPTGAAIVSALAKPSGQMPVFTITKIGYGAGTWDLPLQPNILRIAIGESSSGSDETEYDNVCILETNIDNVSPEIIGYLVDKLFKEGALDVFTIPIQMKKSRPGILLKVIAALKNASQMEEIIFTEIPTLGIRKSIARRVKLRRESSTVSTKYGNIRIKKSYYNGKAINAAPEYEDCRQAAEQYHKPLREIITEALKQ